MAIAFDILQFAVGFAIGFISVKLLSRWIVKRWFGS